MTSTPKAEAKKRRTVYGAKVTHDEMIKYLENESMRIVCILFENAKDKRVFKTNMRQLVDTVTELTTHRHKSSLLNTYFRS